MSLIPQPGLSSKPTIVSDILFRVDHFSESLQMLDARQHGLTPFSVYQGKWNAAYRDMEGEIIPMCEDQGMAIVPWAALGSGQLLSAEQRRARENDPDAAQNTTDEKALTVSNVLEQIASEKKTSFQAIVSKHC